MAYFSLKTFFSIYSSEPSLVQLFGPWTIHRCNFGLENGDIKLTPAREATAVFSAVDIRQSSDTSSLSGLHFVSAMEMLVQQWESMSIANDEYPVVFFEGVPVDARTPMVVECGFSENQAGTLRQILRFQSSAETTKIVKSMALRDDGLSWEHLHRHFSFFYRDAPTETLGSVVRHLKDYCRAASYAEKVVVVDEGSLFSLVKYSDLPHQTANAITPDFVDGNVIGITIRGLKAAGSKSNCQVYSYASVAHLQLDCYSADGRVFILVSSRSPFQRSIEIKGIRAADVGAAYFSPSASHLVLCSPDYAKVTVCELSEIREYVVTLKQYSLYWNPGCAKSVDVSLTEPHPSSGVVSIWFIPGGYSDYRPVDPHDCSPTFPCQAIRHFPYTTGSEGYIRQKCNATHSL
jgi:hypothetical protein